MKRNIIAVITFAVVLVSCQKNLDAPMNTGTLSTASASDVQMINPAPVVTFGNNVLSHAVSTFTDVIFSDSFYVSQNQAYLQVMKIDVKGIRLRFSNYSIHVNGVRSNVTGTYENGLITIVLNRRKPLPVGAYYFEVRAKVGGPAQEFKLKLQKGNALITDKYGFNANIIGLPLQASVQIQK
jgi:hypothetical protein